jgi:hypothetical protein
LDSRKSSWDSHIVSRLSNDCLQALAKAIQDQPRYPRLFKTAALAFSRSGWRRTNLALLRLFLELGFCFITCGLRATDPCHRSTAAAETAWGFQERAGADSIMARRSIASTRSRIHCRRPLLPSKICLQSGDGPRRTIHLSREADHVDQLIQADPPRAGNVIAGLSSWVMAAESPHDEITTRRHEALQD